MKYLLSIMACAAFAFSATAQDTYNDKVQQYIDKYKDVAMAEMQRSGVPASITLAQGILESSCGNSPLATKGNNHFGIKCHDGWEGKSMSFDDDHKDECFRCYESVDQSFKDHSDFLRTRQRYAFLFEYSPTDYKKWAYGLKQAGYATNPNYPEMLINNIEKFNLNQYDIYESFADNSNSPKPQTNEQKDSNRLGEVWDNIENKISTTTSTSAQSSDVFYVNHVKAVRLTSEKTVEQVSTKYRVRAEHLLKYNELNTTAKLPAGTIVYLQPKRRQGDSLYHVVKNNETMYDISQQHVIRLQYLYVKNNMEQGTQPANNEVIYLREKRGTVPILRGNEPAKVITESSTLTTIGTKPVNATTNEEPTLNYAKPMPADPLFPKTEEDKNPSTDLQPAQNDTFDKLSTGSVNVTPNDATYTTASTEPSINYITSTETEGVDYYTVKTKDTLYSIAHAHGLTVNQLMEINQLGSNVISVGMRLRLK